MKQPGKPRWKRWILAATAAVSLAGAGAVMTPPDISMAPPPSPDAQSSLGAAIGPVGVPDDIVALFNIQARTPAQEALNAARTNDLRGIQMAVAKGYNLHDGSDQILNLAVSSGSLDVAQYTLAHGADVNANKGAPLESAAIQGNLKMVELLVANGADVNINDSGPLFWTVMAGNHAVANHLVDHGAKVTMSMMIEAHMKSDKAMIDILSPSAPSTHVTAMFPPVPPAPSTGL